MGIFKDGKRRIGYFCVWTDYLDEIIKAVVEDAPVHAYVHKSRRNAIYETFVMSRRYVDKEPLRFMIALEKTYVVAVFEDWDKNRTCKIYRLTPKEINLAKSACGL